MVFQGQIPGSKTPLQLWTNWGIFDGRVRWNLRSDDSGLGLSFVIYTCVIVGFFPQFAFPFPPSILSSSLLKVLPLSTMSPSSVTVTLPVPIGQ